MDTQRFAEIKARVAVKSTEELLQIWVTHDTDEWSEDAFQVVKQILSERNAPIPEQNPPPAKPLPKKPSGKGFLWCGGILIGTWAVAIGEKSFILGAMYPIVGLWTFVGLCLGAGVCFLWYRLSSRREVAGPVRRFFGGLLFFFGCGEYMYLGMVSLLPVLGVAQKQGVPPSPEKLIFAPLLFLVVFGLILLLPSYLLYFKRAPKKDEH